MENDILLQKFVELYPTMARIAAHALINPSDVDDCLQTVSLMLLKINPKSISNPGAYLNRCVTNHAKKMNQQQSRREQVESENDKDLTTNTPINTPIKEDYNPILDMPKNKRLDWAYQQLDDMGVDDR